MAAATSAARSTCDGGDTLYGRVWGCRQPFEFLHFEACYYQAIEFAIDRGLARVEAGAQGPHKLQRGYEPVPTYSAHWIRDPGFRAAVERFLTEERAEMACEMEQSRELLPYRPGRRIPIGDRRLRHCARGSCPSRD